MSKGSGGGGAGGRGGNSGYANKAISDTFGGLGPDKNGIPMNANDFSSMKDKLKTISEDVYKTARSGIVAKGMTLADVASNRQELRNLLTQQIKKRMATSLLSNDHYITVGRSLADSLINSLPNK